MEIWAVANQKGGVGKTTSAVSLGGLLSNQGYRTLLVDMDPHGSLTTYFGYDPDFIKFSIYNLFNDNSALITKQIAETRFERLSLLGASSALTTLDKQLAGENGKGLVLSRALSQLAGQYDYVIIDTPPLLGILMVNALAACHRLIIPVQTEYLAMRGLQRMLHTLTMINRSLKKMIPHLILPTFFDVRTKSSQHTLAYLKETYPDLVWNTLIPIDTKFREASEVGAPISDYAPFSRGARAYDAFLYKLQAGSIELTAMM